MKTLGAASRRRHKALTRRVSPRKPYKDYDRPAEVETAVAADARRDFTEIKQEESMPQVISKELVVVDYPEEDEKISSQHYTIRVGVHEEAQKVEVSIDDGPWQQCRSAVGFWWYDWSKYQPGQHHVVGRAHLRDGHTFTTAPRPFRVESREPAVLTRVAATRSSDAAKKRNN